MKESDIRNLVREELLEKGYHNDAIWFAPNVKWHSTDIWGVIDMMAVKGKKVRRIQYTNYSSISKHKKKIKEWKDKTGAEISIEIWGWNKKKKEFRKITV